MSALPLVADTLELAVVRSFQAKTQKACSLFSFPTRDQSTLESISSLVPWASILRYVRQRCPLDLSGSFIGALSEPQTRGHPRFPTPLPRVLPDRTKARQPSQFSAFLLILPHGEGVGSCRLPEKIRDPSTVWRPHPNLSFFFEFTNTPTWSFQLEEKNLSLATQVSTSGQEQP